MDEKLLDERTPATSHYPSGALRAARERISSQALWLLLSLDRYGWRVEHDLLERILDVQDDSSGPVRVHARLAATSQVIQAIDKLWRLIFAIRAHRDGRELLNGTDGYLMYGGNLDKQLEDVASVDEAEWRELLAIPNEAEIRRALEHMPEEEVLRRVDFANAVPSYLVAFLTALRRDLTGRAPAERGMREETYSLRDLDNAGRHSMPAVYLDCSPTDTGWAPVEDSDESLPDPSALVGMIMLPPNDAGSAFISLVTDDVEFLRLVSARVANVIYRLTRAYLASLAPGLVDSLASVDYDPL